MAGFGPGHRPIADGPNGGHGWTASAASTPAEPEETTETQIGIRRNHSAPFDNGVDAALREINGDGDSEAILAVAHRSQVFIQQYLPWGHKASGYQQVHTRFCVNCWEKKYNIDKYINFSIKD